MKKLSALLLMFFMLPVVASPVKLWSYSDTCAVFSLSINSNGSVGLAFGYYAELLNPGGKLLWKAPTRGIAYSSALSDNGVLLIGTEGKWLQAFENGKVIWERELSNAVVSVAISPNGSVAVAGDASGWVYLFKDGKIVWKKKAGNYVWSVYLGGNTLLVGSDSGIHAFSTDGEPLWEKNPGPVRKVLVANTEVLALVVPESESWSELVALDKNGNVLWEKRFNGYVRGISTDGKDVALAGNFGNVTLLGLDGKTIYTVPLIGYAYDVATQKGYTVVSYGKTAELIAPNGTVIWFKRFNGTAYHVAFSPKGYFITEYGSHDVQNCYSVLDAWSLSGTPTVTVSKPSERPSVNPYVAGTLTLLVLVMGVLLWRKQS